MPFLEVITRCFKRPQMLDENQRSLDAQTCDDWEQVLFVDDVGIGIEGANAQLANYEPGGDYVWVLDDDDQCAVETLVADLKAIAAAHDPDVIMVRMDHGYRGILPDDEMWGERPRLGRVGVSAPIVRRELWMANGQSWIGGGYCGDFQFIDGLFERDPVVYWHDVIASRVQKISHGMPE